jgi:hypothetical protein
LSVFFSNCLILLFYVDVYYVHGEYVDLSREQTAEEEEEEEDVVVSCGCKTNLTHCGY